MSLLPSIRQAETRQYSSATTPAQMDHQIPLLEEARNATASLEEMRLSPDEAALAWQLKRDVESNQELTALSDFEYAQYAICAIAHGESTEETLQRMAMLQAFKREYGLNDTAQQGLEMLEAWTLQHPGMLLSIEKLASSQNYVGVLDWGAFYPSRLVTHEDFRTLLGGLYYMFEALNCQLQSIRSGYSMLVECMDVTTDHHDVRLFDRLAQEFLRWYPRIRKEIFLQNAPGVVLFAINTLKKHLPQTHRAIQLGQQVPGLEGYRLDQIYATPSKDQARIRMLIKAYSFLSIRYNSRKGFVLSPGS